VGNHYVPRQYLRGFAADEAARTIWMFDKSTMEFGERPVAIGKVAQRSGYYSPEDEVALNDLVERPGNLVLKKLRENPDLLARDLSQEERAHFSFYIATMLSRVPHKRNVAATLLPDALDTVVDSFKDEYSRFSWKFGVGDLERQSVYEEAERIRERLKSDTPSDMVLQLECPWPMNTWIEAIFSSHWYFVAANENVEFVTTDNPFFYFGCFGVGSGKAEFTFPISTRRALFGTNVPCREKRGAKSMPALVRESNRRLISAATRFVFASEPHSWVRTVASKRKPYLSRVLPDGVGC
jgi:hypothetical protein